MTQGDDFIVIEPRPIVPATVHCYADHRIAMSFALMGLVAALAQMLIGVVIGSFSGLYGGRVDMLLMRFVDIMIAIPFLIWVSLFMLVLTPGVGSIIVALAARSP